MPPFIAMPRVLARPPRRRKVDGRISIGRLPAAAENSYLRLIADALSAGIGRLVPEPASAVLPGLGTLLCDARRRRA